VAIGYLSRSAVEAIHIIVLLRRIFSVVPECKRLPSIKQVYPVFGVSLVAAIMIITDRTGVLKL
jgi:hypothetical protein